MYESIEEMYTLSFSNPGYTFYYFAQLQSYTYLPTMYLYLLYSRSERTLTQDYTSTVTSRKVTGITANDSPGFLISPRCMCMTCTNIANTNVSEGIINERK